MAVADIGYVRVARKKKIIAVICVQDNSLISKRDDRLLTVIVIVVMTFPLTPYICQFLCASFGTFASSFYNSENESYL